MLPPIIRLGMVYKVECRQSVLDETNVSCLKKKLFPGEQDHLLSTCSSLKRYPETLESLSEKAFTSCGWHGAPFQPLLGLPRARSLGLTRSARISP